MAGRRNRRRNGTTVAAAGFRRRRHGRAVLCLGAALPAVLPGDRLWRHDAARRRRRRRESPTRSITVRFDAQVAPDLDWEFRPLTDRGRRCIPASRARCSSAPTNRSAAPVTAHGDLQRDADQGRHLFRQAAVLLLQQQTLAPGESVDMGVVVLCRSRHADRSEHQRGAHDHAVLHDVPRARDGAARAAAAAPPTAGSNCRKLSDPADSDDRHPHDLTPRRSARRRRSIPITWSIRAHGRSSARSPPACSRPAACCTCTAMAGPLMIIGFLAVLATMAVWWRDVIREATFRAITRRSCSSACATAWRCSSPPR